jgi:hypothetical protein
VIRFCDFQALTERSLSTLLVFRTFAVAALFLVHVFLFFAALPDALRGPICAIASAAQIQCKNSGVHYGCAPGAPGKKYRCICIAQRCRVAFETSSDLLFLLSPPLSSSFMSMGAQGDAQFHKEMEESWDVVDKLWTPNMEFILGAAGAQFVRTHAIATSCHEFIVATTFLACMSPLTNGATMKLFANTDSPLNCAAVLVGYPQTRKSQMTKLCRDILMHLDQHIQEQAAGHLGEGRGANGNFWWTGKAGRVTKPNRAQASVRTYRPGPISARSKQRMQIAPRQCTSNENQRKTVSLRGSILSHPSNFPRGLGVACRVLCQEGHARP